MSLRRSTLALAAGLAGLLLPIGCGGDGKSDKEQITEAIVGVYTGAESGRCTELQTTRFTEQSTFESGQAAIEQCEEDLADESDEPDAVEVTDISVDGDAATADAVFDGGSLHGSAVSVALVKEDDQWKLDELTGIPKLNFEGFKRGFTEEAAGSGELSRDLANCIVQSFDRAGEERVKTLIISGDGQQLNQLIADCVPAG